MREPQRRQTVTAPDLRRSRVAASALVVGVGGKNIGPGQLVDLDEVVGDGHRVRDLFPEHFFDAVEPPAAITPIVNEE